jgi:3-deoxy-7-phosphoheptulonate synthase
MHSSALGIDPIYASHEGLLLCYEAALTRKTSSGYFNLSTHFLWLGERTRRLGSAHIEYFHGVENPIGLKIGPNANLEELAEILKQLNPRSEQGKLVLIPRMGVGNVSTVLPRVVKVVQESGVPHLWEVDPMHGNTFKTSDGIKTRRLADVTAEVIAAFETLQANGEHLSGMHLETTYEEVTECIGGLCGVTETDLCLKYKTLCDPRLNGSQTEELLKEVGARMSTISS